MIKGINQLETKKFVSTKDTDAEKTTWEIAPLSNRVLSRVTALCADKDSLDGIIEAVSFGLKGFEKFKKRDGSDIQFVEKQRVINGKTFNVVEESILELIPFEILCELGSEILKISKMSEEEEKN